MSDINRQWQPVTVHVKGTNEGGKLRLGVVPFVREGGERVFGNLKIAYNNLSISSIVHGWNVAFGHFSRTFVY